MSEIKSDEVKEALPILLSRVNRMLEGIERRPIAGVKEGPDSLQKDYLHALVLSEHFINRFRWAAHRGTWMEYSGVVWRPVPEERVAKIASDELQKEFTSRLAEAREKDLIMRFTAALREVCIYRRITGALYFLRGWDGIMTAAQEWDADQWLLNVNNGVVDLRSGKLRPHNPNDLLTKLAPVDFDETATGPKWEAHLARCLPQGNIRRQVQRSLGVALVGGTLEEHLDLWHGGGANGKSTTSRAIQAVIGDYSKKAAPNLLLQSKYDRHPTEIADLCGARIVFSIEVDQGKRLAEALVKDLSGGDRKKARFMRGDFFEFEQTFSIILLVNHLPVITGTDVATWRRIRRIPWEYEIPREERRSQDEFVEELVHEGSYMLRWMLQGLRDWQSDPQWEAPEVVAASAAYRQEQDRLGAYLSDWCEFGPHFEVKVSDLHEHYTKWCEENGEEAVGKREFGKLLRERGGISQRKRGHERVHWWTGIRVRTNADNDSISPNAKSEVGENMEGLSSIVRMEENGFELNT